MGGLSSCRIWKRACRMRKRQQQLPITDVRNGDKFSCTTFLMGGEIKGDAHCQYNFLLDSLMDR